jgi:hypothetical protein
MTVRVTHNRQVEFAFGTNFHGHALQGRLEVSASLGWEHEDALESALPDVNRPSAGGSA